MEWELGKGNPRTCDDCAATFAKLKKDTPCHTCKKVWPLPENETAASIFGIMLSQLRIAGMGGVTGVDYNSLPFFFDMFDVPDDQRHEVFRKLELMMNKAIELLNPPK